ncbi:MAG: RsmB/NOP family class I SAM-dependent RNA methyltransferase, partial [Pseudomonadota bacterium]
SRFAGSKDRAAVRDIVFDAVRKRRSCGAWPTGSTRLWVARLLADAGTPHDQIFGNGPYGPIALTDREHAALADNLPHQHNVPDWIDAEIRASGAGLTDAPADILAAYDLRAPLFLRVNRRNATVAQVREDLSHDGIETETVLGLDWALKVTTHPRQVAQSRGFLGGQFEVQDASSQTAAEDIPIGGAVLDYCAGGGGKALAFADRGAKVTAHDSSAARLANVDDRIRRAGVTIAKAAPGSLTPHDTFDTVFCDVPCSGSGAWRRNPAAKWALTPDDLASYGAVQRDIVTQAMQHCRSGGYFVYATCSIFAAENTAQVAWAQGQCSNLTLLRDRQLSPVGGNGDGFYYAVFAVE